MSNFVYFEDFVIDFGGKESYRETMEVVNQINDFDAVKTAYYYLGTEGFLGELRCNVSVYNEDIRKLCPEPEKGEWFTPVSYTHLVSAYDTYYNYLEQGDSYDYLRSITIYMLLGFIVFMFLVKYIIDSSRYEYVVYSIVGASRKKVVGIMIAEILGITLLTSIVAMLFHHLFYEVIFDKINYFSGLQYHVEAVSYTHLDVYKRQAIYHNAKVQLESKPGEGKIVTIIFEKAQ